jgi:hypothetical protein
MLDSNAKRLFWYLFAGSRGGNNRIKIIDFLKERPYHIMILEKNSLVSKIGEKYGIVYFISNYLEANIEAFNEIKSKIKK